MKKWTKTTGGMLVSSLMICGCGNGSESQTSPAGDGGAWDGTGGMPSADGSYGAGGGSSVPSVDAGTPCTKSGPITANTTWRPTPDCPDGFDVPDEVSVLGAGTQLTIAAGTTLKFGPVGGLDIQLGAALMAVGTEAHPITFTGWQELEGSWGGIDVYSSAVQNEISHAIIEYAGSPAGSSGALTLVAADEGPGRIKLTHTALQRNKGFGLTVHDGAALATFEGNTITNNLGGAIRVDATAVGQLRGAGNTIERNGGGNIVQLEAGGALTLETDATWPSLSPAVYRVTSGDVEVAAHLTIEAGAVFEMAGTGFNVSYANSGLAALGTESAPVVFRGVDGSSWKGIGFLESGWSGNALEYVHVTNALGPPEAALAFDVGSAWQTPGIAIGNILATNPSNLRIKNLIVAGPNSAPADIGVTAPVSTLVQEGENEGTGPSHALLVEYP